MGTSPVHYDASGSKTYLVQGGIVFPGPKAARSSNGQQRCAESAGVWRVPPFSGGLKSEPNFHIAGIMMLMRLWLCMFFLAGFMAASLPARAEGETFPQVRIAVGEAYQLRLGFIIVGLVCDDNSLVRVEDGGDHLRLVGLAPGRTKCGFWSNPQSPAPSKVYEVVVTRAPPPKR
jgi:hypothetical protein